MATDVDVVILDKHETVAELRAAHQLGNLLQNSFAGFVMRMRFAGEQELHWALWVIDHGCQVFHVLENQVRALVGGEATCEADRQRIRTENASQPLQTFRRFPATLCLLHQSSANESQQLR